MLKKIKIENIWWLFIAMILIIFHLKHLLSGDEGVILNGAWNLINNKKLYYDFFEFIPPGSFYYNFLIWKIFGVSYWTIKIASIVILLFSSIGIYKISQKITNHKTNLFLPVVFAFSSSYWPIINHNLYNLFFIIWATFFFIKALEEDKKETYLISGLLSGISILFLQQKGFVLIFCLTSFLLFLSIKNKNYFKKIFYYLLPAIIIPLFCLLFWPASLLYKNLIDFPLFHYIEANKITYSYIITALTSTLLLFFLIKREKNKKIWFLFYLQICLLLSTIPLPDFFHISLILFPSYCLSIFFINKLNELNKLKKIILSLSILAFLYIAIFPTVYTLAYSNADVFEVFSSFKNETFRFAQKNCTGQYLYAGPFISGMYFELKKENATPYSILITGHQTTEQFTEAANQLKIKKPTCAILAYPASLKRFKHKQNNPVENYIRENYNIIYSDFNEKDESTVFIYKIK